VQWEACGAQEWELYDMCWPFLCSTSSATSPYLSIRGSHLSPRILSLSAELTSVQDHDPDAYYDAYDSAKQLHLLRLMREVKVAALTKVATRLRHGVPCKIPALAALETNNPKAVEAITSQMGGQNCHVDIVFDDGVTWLARFRLVNDPTLPPLQVANYVFTSEVATMYDLTTTKVRVPRVFHYAKKNASDNQVGLTYFLMEKLPGKSLDWNSASKAQKSKIMEQLADIFLVLESQPYNKIGSLFLEQQANKGTRIAGFAQPSLFASADSAPLGPFVSAKDALQAIIRLQLRLISIGEVASLPLDNYLANRWKFEMIPKLCATLKTDKSGPKFYLKHNDDKGDHLLVKKDFSITAVIDWEYASTEVKELAFTSPCMMWPVGDFYDGKNNMSPEELEFASIFRRRGRNDMAEIILKGRKWQRFLFSLSENMPSDQAEFETLFQGLRAAMEEQSDPHKLEPYAQWREKAIAKYAKNDASLQRLLREARAHSRQDR
jgi:Phosphotransferase enzyme family